MKDQSNIAVAVRTAGSNSSVGARRALAELGADRIGDLRDCRKMPFAPAAGPEVGGRLNVDLGRAQLGRGGEGKRNTGLPVRPQPSASDGAAVPPRDGAARERVVSRT